MSRPVRNLTLHLLQALDALLVERNVSRAADRMGVSQSTMSNNLADLRQLLGDPLLVREGAGLVPTPKALAVGEPIREALRQIADAVGMGGEFVPSRDRRTFAILAADFVQPLLTLPLVERWRALSDGLALAMLPLDLDTLQQQLASGHADVAILKSRFAPQSLRHKLLFSDRFAVLARRQHGSLKAPLDLAQYLACPHVATVATGRRVVSSVDDALEGLGQHRNVTVCVPQHVMAAQLAASTDLLATVPLSFAMLAAADDRLCVHELPFHVTGLDVLLVWHERSHHEPAHRWLREALRAVVEVALPRPPLGHPAA